MLLGMLSPRSYVFAAFFSALAMQAAAEGQGVSIAVSPVSRTALGETPVTIALKSQHRAVTMDSGHCYIVIEGLTADRPVGTGYDISIATAGGAGTADRRTAIGALSFYNAIGISPTQSVPASFEVPSSYCAATNKEKVIVTIAPDHRPVVGSNPLIGVVKLIAQ
jgi:hypothetical protein